ncbi:MAG: hypothetical protein AAFS11_00860 [Planctomycetota bacterium]
MPRAERNTTLGLGAIGLLALAGCSTPTAPPPEPIAVGDSDWVWTEGDAGDAPANGLAALAAQAAADAQWLLEQGGQAPDDTTGRVPVRDAPPPLVLDRPAREAAHRTDDPTTPQPQDGLLRALSLAGGGPGVLRTAPPPAIPQPTEQAEAPPPTKAELDRGARIAELAGELSMLLKEDAALADDPGRPLVAAALLESIASGVLPEADLPGGGKLMLTEDERASLLALRSLAVRLVGDESDVAGDPQRVREVLLDAAEGLREHARVHIVRAELCKRAPGFGSYVPLERRTFLAGRTNRVVVYAEVDHFGLRPASEAEAAVEGDRVAADLKQEMELYLRAGDPSPTWQRTVNWLPQTSRRGFRDLFVATPIELPATLSVGEYDLKVRIIDEVSGAQDEATVPIRLVADASALRGEPSERQAERDRRRDTPEQGGFLPSFASRAGE